MSRIGWWHHCRATPQQVQVGPVRQNPVAWHGPEGGDVVDRYGSVQASGLGDREVGDAVEALRRIRADRPERGPRAVELIRFILRGDPNRASARVQHLDVLLEMADGVPETPDWVRDRACARTAALMYAAAEQRITDPGAALRELDELERQAAGAPGA